jgi:hypothetical protein
MTFETYPEGSPFNTQEWIEFLKNEAEKSGMSFSSYIAYLTQATEEEYRILEKTFITKYKKKNG